MLELQTLGERLIGWPDSELAAIPVPAELLEAIRAARHMSKRGALHRQKQFIGRLMREIDTTPIREAIARKKEHDRTMTARFHIIEDWRDRLIAEGDTALAALLEEKPAADRQHLRRLIRDAVAERNHDAAPRAARQLFRYLVQLMD